MTALLATLVGLVLAAAVLVVVKTTSQSHLARQLATVAGAVCLVLFVMINVSDWPGGFMNRFWLDHAIVGSTAGTLLLAATVFLIYRYRDQKQQELVDESVVDAGRAELVDRLFEVDVALALLGVPTEPDLCRSQWQKPLHGLDWLRGHLDEASVVVDKSWSEIDPRLRIYTQHVPAEDWRLPVLDELVRRVADGVREWGPILMRSRAGERDLVAFANVRVVLQHLDHQLRQGVPMERSLAGDLQHVVRRFARVLVVDENTPEPRAKLLVPAFEEELAKHPIATMDEPAKTLLQRIEEHVESRVQVEKRRRRFAGHPHRTRELQRHAAPLDAFTR